MAKNDKDVQPDSVPGVDWADSSTRGLSSPQGDTPALRDDIPDMDSFFNPSRSDGEPKTLFDADAPRPPRELRIASDGLARTLPAGHIINERFEVRACLAVGNVGAVYLVDDLRLKDKKALKLMHPTLVDSAEASQRFISEIKTLQRLSHEHIIRIYDFGRTDQSELSFFTMEYVEGATLADVLRKKGGHLPPEKAVHLATQLLDTLSYAHQHTTHRNLKPVNIMVRPTGKIVLLNFGISTTASSMGLAAPTVRLGASHYQAPEQRENPEIPDRRVDIYATGAILYQMLTGNIPLENPTPPSRVHPQIPRPLDRVVMRSIAPRPDHRYPDAAAMKAALERAMAPRPGRATLMLLIAAAALGAIAWWYFQAPTGP